jgi:hypothetical protein
MKIEHQIKKEIETLERIKPTLAKFFTKRVYGEWELNKEDVRLVDEVGFGLTGIPVYGPEIIQEIPHIDIAVIENAYKGPKSNVQDHPIKILFPRDPETGNYLKEEIFRVDKLDVDDLIKGKSEFFKLPTIEVGLEGDVTALVPEPASHVEYFASDTILFYTENQVGEDKLREWFIKLLMIRDVAKVRNSESVQEKSKEMVFKSKVRWRHKGWTWLNVDNYETHMKRVSLRDFN